MRSVFNGGGGGGGNVAAPDKPRILGTITDLKAIAPSLDHRVVVLGYASTNDRGGGSFVWEPTATDPDNGDTVISPASSPSQGRWKRVLGMEGVSLAWTGAKGDGVTDSAAAIRRAANLAASLNGRVVVPEPAVAYRVDSTVDVPDGARFVGEGFRYPGKGAGTFRRGANVTMFRVLGTSIKVDGSGQGRRAYVGFRDVRFDGNGFSANLVEMTAATVCYFDSCHFGGGATGRLLLARELMDSRFTDCVFDGGGNADGSIPAVELASGGAIPGDAEGRTYEFTNQVHFVGCRWEAYNGRALDTSGLNTNEIYFQSCKMESLRSTVSHVRLRDAVGVHLDGLNIASQGHVDPTATIPAQLEIIGGSNVNGTLYVEHVGTPGVNAAALTGFVRLAGARRCRLHASVYGGSQDKIAGASLFHGAGTLDATNELSALFGDGTSVKIATDRPRSKLHVHMHAPGGGAQVWLNMPAGQTEFRGQPFHRTKADLLGMTRFRLHAFVTVVGFAGSTLKLQYSLDGVTWTDANAGGVGIDALDLRTSAVLELAAAARTDVQLRLVGIGGDGLADPAFGNCYAEFF